MRHKESIPRPFALTGISLCWCFGKQHRTLTKHSTCICMSDLLLRCNESRSCYKRQVFVLIPVSRVALPIQLIRTHVPLRYKVMSIGWKIDPALGLKCTFLLDTYVQTALKRSALERRPRKGSILVALLKTIPHCMVMVEKAV
jgi:hypothetical protein